jgi:hypothetical protein
MTDQYIPDEVERCAGCGTMKHVNGAGLCGRCAVGVPTQIDAAKIFEEAVDRLRKYSQSIAFERELSKLQVAADQYAEALVGEALEDLYDWVCSRLNVMAGASTWEQDKEGQAKFNELTKVMIELAKRLEATEATTEVEDER